MKQIKKLQLRVLANSEIFKGFAQKEIEDFLSSISYTIKHYSQNELIALEGDSINELSIILSGEASIEKIYLTGKVIKVKKNVQGDLIGHVSIFSDHNFYPSTIVAAKETTLLFVSQENIIKKCRSDEKFLSNFMKILSNQIIYLSEKLRFMSYSTIRQKLSYYILEEYSTQKNLRIKVSLKRKEMAEVFGITRPALSKELVNMKKDELIDFQKGYIVIKEILRLENEIL